METLTATFISPCSPTFACYPRSQHAAQRTMCVIIANSFYTHFPTFKRWSIPPRTPNQLVSLLKQLRTSSYSCECIWDGHHPRMSRTHTPLLSQSSVRTTGFLQSSSSCHHHTKRNSRSIFAAFSLTMLDAAVLCKSSKVPGTPAISASRRYRFMGSTPSATSCPPLFPA